MWSVHGCILFLQNKNRFLSKLLIICDPAHIDGGNSSIDHPPNILGNHSILRLVTPVPSSSPLSLM